ncbi:hypothetical protein A6E01_20510 (plasmid) [Vibrio breoganii]|uniref:Uncharacterized protein n=1 Tax=Vibrio breoganii TaxID=553239 RepID=A0AAN1CUD6_9VIBR|nr:hypothetical protein [Vibrio breoganii]ANO35598.1 hypothetical protein A6E01_20510 [Vibrio breoganii]
MKCSWWQVAKIKVNIAYLRWVQASLTRTLNDKQSMLEIQQLARTDDNYMVHLYFEVGIIKTRIKALSERLYEQRARLS